MLGSLLALAARMGLGNIYTLSADYGSSDNINIHQVNAARRKIHRGKMYRRFRGQKLPGKLARRYAR